MDRIAVLTSGGLDSAVLLATLADEADVVPVYVEFGLAWEETEKQALQAFLAAFARPQVGALTVLQIPAASLYGHHWSTTGAGVPDAASPDSAVYLPGRNVLLLGLTAVWCSLNDVARIAIGSLDENPFPDATPAFFADYSRLLSDALSHDIEVVAPFRGLHKWDLIARHSDLPLHLTLTCIDPNAGVHCGSCNKCFERQEAFRKAGVADRTVYGGAPA